MIQLPPANIINCNQINVYMKFYRRLCRNFFLFLDMGREYVY